VKWLILILGIASNASASVLVKFAMLPPRRVPSLSEPSSYLLNGPLWLGVIFYACAFVLYAAALARLPLNVAHPILTSGAIATVASLSFLLFHETFHWTTVVGLMLVIMGVVLIGLRA
jgi:multidrug transporter EmrE-like cation transporter